MKRKYVVVQVDCNNNIIGKSNHRRASNRIHQIFQYKLVSIQSLDSNDRNKKNAIYGSSFIAMHKIQTIRRP